MLLKMKLRTSYSLYSLNKADETLIVLERKGEVD